MKKCACRGSFLERFIQPAILMQLNQAPLHGFSIYKRLMDSDYMDYSGIDPTGLYRTLKKMEQNGTLTSCWDMETSAQPRRVYEITDDGRQCLAYWEDTLRDYAEAIGKLSAAVTQSIRGES